MDFTDINNIGKTYKGFVLLSIDDLPDYKTKAVYLRHKRTGLEVYHILAQDKENLFSFAFRTVAKDNFGAAHIMEHSTLCGSEKYPLKEPFNTLASTSLNTFLNALTYPDKTVYPGASVVKADYFNMLDVYADCVFFPKLDYETFIQEGHRLELDENGKLSIQGVVYNEMKGNYSSFVSVAYSQMIGAMFPDSYPAFDSGGDPQFIPELTYQQFLDFHQKFYNPDNCLLFLYGDIPTSEQLDYFDENFISRIEEKYNCKNDVSYAELKTPYVKDEIKELQKLNLNTESKLIKDIAPETGSTGSLVVSNWYTGEVNIEKYFLNEVLCGNDSSPMTMLLNDSGLGDDVCTGNFGQFTQEFFSFGLSGVKKGDEEKVFDLVEKSIQKVYEEGIDQDEIDSAITGIDFNLREVNRYFGPPSIQIMEKVLKGWSQGKPCCTQLTPITSFEKLKTQIRADKDFTKKLIKKYFIDNKIKIDFIAEPTNEFFEIREKNEKALIEKLSEKINKEELKKELDALHKYQQKIETPEETACIPTTKLSTLEKKLDYPKTEVRFLKGKGDFDIPLLINKEDTNGIFYFDVLFPYDNLPAEYYQYMPFFSNVITNLGWDGKSWDDCYTESGCVMGDLWGRLLNGFIDEAPEFDEVYNKYKKYNFMGRNYISISTKALTSMAKDTFDLMAKIVTKMDFNDVKRFEQMVGELKAEKKAGIVSGGMDYATKRAKATLNTGDAIGEIQYGISQLNTIANYSKMDLKKLLKTFEFIYTESVKNGGLVHIVADEESLKVIEPLLSKFVIETDIKPLIPVKNKEIKDFLPFIYQIDDANGDFCQQDIKIESQTGYAAAISKASNVLTKEAAAEMVFTAWFRNHSLWDKVRTTGGAYGALSYVDPSCRMMVLSSYRDPNPVNTIKVFTEALKEVTESKISEDDIEKTIVSCYGDVIVPQTARDRGTKAFSDFIYAITPEIRQKKLDYLLAVTPEDVNKAVENLYQGTKEMYRTAVFCDKKVETCGKIINIPL